ncbi:hypothetical protein HBI88_059580 [Parastagonospora nodorum]|nr:hypothetical protein HBH50_106930 [Parastagonospora nodorum]KAH4088023.1 hypothetical protein HBH48_123890 [Parastagonospora nodorum]KAH5036630.1 hypothetical protein HBI74_053510 [Parastagonospora nodorum]KAH5333027.1 hypothetical protein HBI50_050490 [Parastagonospora nodorum]KAH5798244.1 hypothetical protein HBI97_008000 [Parastagonospora nodorum]
MPMTMMHRRPGKKPSTFKADGSDSIPVRKLAGVSHELSNLGSATGLHVLATDEAAPSKN